MRFYRDYVLRKWNPIFWGIVTGFLLPSAVLALTAAENNGLPFDLFSFETVVTYAVFLVICPFVFWAYTVFIDKVAPPQY